jgi:ATP-dependent DNA helicase RecG
MALRPDTSVQYIKGIGPKLGDLLCRKGLKTVQDLIEFYPRAYEDQRAARNIASLKADDIVSLKATVVKIHAIPLGRTQRKMYDVIVRDASGQIHCKFFRVPYKGYFERFASSTQVRVVGKVTNYRGRLEFHHPDLRDLESEDEIQDSLNPIYTEIEAMSSQKIMKMIRSALEQAKVFELELEKLPPWILKENNFASRYDSLKNLHSPDSQQAREYIEMKSLAHQRIIFEEFFWLELYLAARKTGFKKSSAPVIPPSKVWVNKLLKAVPFKLTKAQLRVYDEIEKDLSSGSPMHRLVQGDVGSGKTMVALMAALAAIESGHQCALMAPTEILAEQHLQSMQKYLKDSGVNTTLLSGKTKTAERKKIFEALAAGQIDLLIGTHALIEDEVKFKSLGLVIIDEQHRFGVEQRGVLKAKGQSPHFLVMTATPIPRTLAMTVYGDLDVSVIDEMPPGRTPIQTRVVFQSKRTQVLDFMREQVEKGRQAYFVYALVEESEKIDLKNAVEEYEKLKSEFPKIRFGLLHGQMKPVEKEEMMDKMRSHQIDVLVSTTVIEVGVDVPNANMMVIENAERFGLSQLHQLRGRVGRGDHKSFCIMLLGYAVSEEARQRTEFMEKTTDGFKIAEFDLEMRGPGEFMGTRQSGLAGFKMANLVRDILLLQKARDAAFKILSADPLLKKKENEFLRAELLRSRGPAALAGIA